MDGSDAYPAVQIAQMFAQIIDIGVQITVLNLAVRPPDTRIDELARQRLVGAEEKEFKENGFTAGQAYLCIPGGRPREVEFKFCRREGKVFET